MPKLIRSSLLTISSEAKLVNSQPKTKSRKSKGFTLIELLISITIIAIMISAGVFSWSKAQEKSRDSKRKSDAKTIQQGLEDYFQKNLRYPTITGPQECSNDWTQLSGALVPGHLTSVPTDPANDLSAEFVYCYVPTGSSNLKYELRIRLENDKDSDVQVFGPPPSYNYVVTNP